MEYVGQRSIKRLCNFYVSELHLSVMLMPYLNRQLNEDVEITTIFEKLEKEKFKIVLDKLNIKNKSDILRINWLNSDIDTYEKIEGTIEKGIKEKKKVTIIIGGNKDYICRNNANIMKVLQKNNSADEIKIINCYNVDEVGKDIKSIIENYDGILNTAGECNKNFIDE
ncbi:MAG: hypothetical protein IKD76_00730 [Clostridia bacterium]|nr:hypothetical protein [Clostridia bacterium]